MTTDPTSILREEILRAWPVNRWEQFNVLVAVSGGGDSVALLRALHDVNHEAPKANAGSLIVAHFNHKLRGSDSDADAEFVSQLSHDLNVKCHTACATAGVQSSNENDLREQRYAFLCDVARETNSRYIVTAHHQDDQIETILFRLFRGTGLSGLCGIPKTRVVDESLTIVRPMLGVGRDMIDAALRSWNQACRTDSSNADSTYTRNFIRNEVLPMLRERFSSVDGSVARLSSQAVEHLGLVREQVEPLFDFVCDEGDLMVVDCAGLQEQSVVLLREMFIEIFRRKSWPVSQLGFDELDHLANLVFRSGEVPRFQLPGRVNCEKMRQQLKLFL